jgi:hypothetical protein
MSIQEVNTHYYTESTTLMATPTCSNSRNKHSNCGMVKLSMTLDSLVAHVFLIADHTSVRPVTMKF